MNCSLTLQGFIVLAPGVFPPHDQSITPEKKIDLDELHLRKIDMSDTIFVVNPHGYIGDSTKKEIRYAWATRKPVGYLTSPLPDITRSRFEPPLELPLAPELYQNLPGDPNMKRGF